MPAERANGPYRHGNKWRVAIHQGGSAVRYRVFESHEEQLAKEYVQSFQEATDNRSIGQTVREYLEHLARYGGPKARRPLRPSSVLRARYHLESIFQLVKGDRPMRALTPTLAAKLYRELVGIGVRTDTHRGSLAMAGQFCTWVASMGWLRANPFAEVRPEGERTVGKLVLRIDDARRFQITAMNEGSPEALACVTVLVLGLRASELCNRKVEDLNISPVVLTISGGKTRASSRALLIPAPLGPLLAAHVAGKERTDRLFNLSRYALHYHVRRLCKAAGVPVVCPHGLRGSASTNIVESVGSCLSVEQAVEQARRQLGHATQAITRSTYIAPGTIQSAEASMKARLLGDRFDRCLCGHLRGDHDGIPPQPCLVGKDADDTLARCNCSGFYGVGNDLETDGESRFPNVNTTELNEWN